LTYSIGPECHPTAKLLNCDSSNPPQCAREAVKYDRGCEQLVAK
jgi:hypothetical protein